MTRRRRGWGTTTRASRPRSRPIPTARSSTTSRTPSRQRPDHPALLFKGSSVSYRTLERLSDACAAAFAALGIGRGDRVALLLPNCPQFFIAELGAWKIGAIVAPLNPIYTERELEAALREDGAIAIRDADAVLPPREGPAAANQRPRASSRPTSRTTFRRPEAAVHAVPRAQATATASRSLPATTTSRALLGRHAASP